MSDPLTINIGKKTCLTPSPGPRAGSLSTWAMLLKRVFEVNPLKCPKCGGTMKTIT